MFRTNMFLSDIIQKVIQNNEIKRDNPTRAGRININVRFLCFAEERN